MNKLMWSVIAAIALGGAGCEWKPVRMMRVSDETPSTANQPPATPAVPASPPTAPKVPEGPSPVEQAMALSQKLKQAEDDLEVVRQENKDLTERSAKLTTQATQATMELAQARNELEDANAMLREMKTELSNWKVSVLGFREEMRTAQAAQLDGMRRILRLLGADEVPAAVAPAKPAGPATSGPSVAIPPKPASSPSAGADGAGK